MAATGAVVEATTMEVKGGKTKVSDVDISPNGVTKGESVESKNPKKRGLYGLWMIVRRNNMLQGLGGGWHLINPNLLKCKGMLEESGAYETDLCGI
ncbi:hypothetical protein JHK87_050031 [Glycine soja]|nr:hypothetical protein JHK87_050031 [Glycine soja]